MPVRGAPAGGGPVALSSGFVPNAVPGGGVRRLRLLRRADHRDGVAPVLSLPAVTATGRHESPTGKWPMGLGEVTVIAVNGGEDGATPLAPISIVRFGRPTLEKIHWSSKPHAAKVVLHFERMMLMLIKGQTAELAPLCLVDAPELERVVREVAEHLGVALDERCFHRLRAGQSQQFALSSASGG